MKTIIRVVLSLLLLSLLAGCRTAVQDKEYLEEVKDIVKKFEIPVVHCPFCGETLKVGELKVKILEYSQDTGKPIFSIWREISAHNHPGSSLLISGLYLTLYYSYGSTSNIPYNEIVGNYIVGEYRWELR